MVLAAGVDPLERVAAQQRSGLHEQRIRLDGVGAEVDAYPGARRNRGEIRDEAIGVIGHRRHPGGASDLAAAGGNPRRAVGVDERPELGMLFGQRAAEALEQREAGSGPTNLAVRDDLLAGARAVERERLAVAAQRADGGNGHDELAGLGDVATHELRVVVRGRLRDAARDALDDGNGGVGRRGEAEEGCGRTRAHSLDVCEVLDNSLVAHFFRRGPVEPEVASLDEEVRGRHRATVGNGRVEDCRVIAIDGAWCYRGDRLDDPLFTNFRQRRGEFHAFFFRL